MTDFTLHGDRFPFNLEKWYVDVLLDDGAVLLVYVARMRLFALPVVRFTAELFLPDGRVVRGGGVGCELRVERAGLYCGSFALEHQDLRFTGEALSADLHFTPRYLPFCVRDPLVEDGARSLRWWVEVPDAAVSGVLRTPEGERRVVGRGYRDRVYFDLLPWRFPLRELIWGRAACGNHACIWWEGRLADEALHFRWQDGVVHRDTVHPASLSDGRVLVDGRVIDQRSLAFNTFAKPLLKRLSADPYHTKWAAAAAIEGAPGRAIHEVVRWH